MLRPFLLYLFANVLEKVHSPKFGVTSKEYASLTRPSHYSTLGVGRTTWLTIPDTRPVASGVVLE